MAISINMAVIKYKNKVRKAPNDPPRAVRIENTRGAVGTKRGPLYTL